jgi:hypothetical protein
VKIEDLKKLKDRRPFRPFMLTTSDGRGIPIVHPDAMAWGDPDNPRLVMAIAGGESYWLDVAHVTSAHAPEPSEPSEVVATDSSGGE